MSPGTLETDVGDETGANRGAIENTENGAKPTNVAFVLHQQ